MRCVVSVTRANGAFVARCAEAPDCEGRGATSAEAVAKLRDQLVFWLEACPCDQTADDGLTLEIREG